MGAAMTNIVFCKPSTKIFIFTPASQIGTFFWLIAQHRKLNYTDVRCHQIGSVRGIMPWDTDISLDLNLIKAIINN